MAANDDWGWLLRQADGRVLTYSAKAPIPVDGVLAGSNPGIAATNRAYPSASSPAVAARNAGEENEFSAVCVGTTMVARGPATLRIAAKREAAPPSIRPIRRREQWMSKS
jgi:hypothetical protein